MPKIAILKEVRCFIAYKNNANIKALESWDWSKEMSNNSTWHPSQLSVEEVREMIKCCLDYCGYNMYETQAQAEASEDCGYAYSEVRVTRQCNESMQGNNIAFEACAPIGCGTQEAKLQVLVEFWDINEEAPCDRELEEGEEPLLLNSNECTDMHRYGWFMDEEGYQQHTANLSVKVYAAHFYDVRSYVASVSDNATTYVAEPIEAPKIPTPCAVDESIDRYLESWDDELVEAFRKEHIL